MVPMNEPVSPLPENSVVLASVLDVPEPPVVEERLVDETLSLTDEPEPEFDSDGSVSPDPEASPLEDASDASNVGLIAVHDGTVSRHAPATTGALKKSNSISASPQPK